MIWTSDNHSRDCALIKANPYTKSRLSAVWASSASSSAWRSTIDSCYTIKVLQNLPCLVTYVGRLKYMHDVPSITQDLEIQEQQWDHTSQDPQFSKAQETFAMRVDRVLLEQNELFEEQKLKTFLRVRRLAFLRKTCFLGRETQVCTRGRPEK